MLPIPLAIAWTFWRQYRWGFLSVAAYLFLAGVLSAVLPGYFGPETARGIVGLLLTVSAIPCALVSVFTYALDGHDLLARESCFPARLFRLPVSTGSLVVWPLIYGAAAAMLLWLIVAVFLARPWLHVLNSDVPLWWPGVFAASGLAWLQAVLWTPIGLTWLRIALASVLAVGLMVMAGVTAQLELPESTLVAGYATLTAAAWTVSYLGVKRARRGDVPNWDAVYWPLRQLARCWPRSRGPFDSAAWAQVWFEWRLSGLTLPIMTALVLPSLLLFLVLGENDVMPPGRTLLNALAVPAFLAGLAGTTATGKNRGTKDHYGLLPFIGTLPLTAAEMVGAKLKSAALSTLATWLVMAVALAVAIALTGHLERAAGWWQQAIHDHPPAQVICGIAAVAGVLLTWTWKRKVDSLYIGLTGREWLAASLFMAGLLGSFGLWILAVWILLHPEMYKTTGISGYPVLASILFIVGLFGSIAFWIVVIWIYNHPETHDATLAVLPWIFSALTLARLLVAAWALRQCLRQGLLQVRTVTCWIAAWLLLASSLFVMLAWVVPSERVPIYYIAFAVLFAMPMARLAASPLALAWNRHR